MTPFVLDVLDAQRRYLKACLIAPMEPHRSLEIKSTDEDAQDKQDVLLAASRLLPRGMLWVASCEDGVILASIIIRSDRRKFRKMWLDMYGQKAPPARGKSPLNGV